MICRALNTGCSWLVIELMRFSKPVYLIIMGFRQNRDVEMNV
jgi:hypothetical protein